MLTNNMEHVTMLPLKGQVSAWTDNNQKYIDPWGPHQVIISSRDIDHIMDFLWQNTEGTTRP